MTIALETMRATTAVLLFLGSVHAQTQVSDVPSYVPTPATGTPVAIAIETEPPVVAAMPTSTVIITDAPVATGQVEAPSAIPTIVSPGCSTCESLASMSQIQSAVDTDSLVCMCPMALSGAECDATVVVADAKVINIECVSSAASCVIDCPATSFVVTSGGRLTLTGNQRLELTGGVDQSRVVVEQGGALNVDGVIFKKYAKKIRRQRSFPLILTLHYSTSSTGNGGAIQSAGALNIESSVFDSCTAGEGGGAIYSTGTLRVIDSSFTANSAGTGGAIFANDVMLFVQGTSFLNNTSADNLIIGGEALLEGCGNTGIDNAPECEPPTSATKARSLLVAVALLLLAHL